MNVNDLITVLENPIVWIGAIVVFVLLAIVLGLRIYRKRQLRKNFEQLEIQYNELISIPLSFKLNKATSLVKVNREIETEVIQLKQEHDDLNHRHTEIIGLLGDTEDLLAFGKLSQALKGIDTLKLLLEDGLKLTHSLDQRLNSILEQETQQRVEITSQKDRFRKVKMSLMSRESLYADSFAILENQTREIENKFSTFEEWMFASDFEKAKVLNAEIMSDIDTYELRIQTIPVLYETSKGKIPQLLDAVSTAFQSARGQGVYLNHLEVPKNIGLITESLKEDILSINHGNVDNVSDHLETLVTRLDQLDEQVQKELKAHEEMVVSSVKVFTVLDDLNEAITALESKASVIAARFEIDDFETRVASYKKRIDDLQEKRGHVTRMMDEEKIPASSIVIAIREMTQDSSILQKDFETIHAEVEQANADEKRAKQQLMKLYLIINDVQVRIKRRSLPAISEQYEHDVRFAKQYARQIDELLSQEVLDVTRLNATVSEAIDFTYKLHNNVNNLVGVLDMCENAIVYANKYRAYIPDIDAELTRAELAFNNGEYTQSLKMIIHAIDRHKPNSSYEELIQKNAQSAR